MQEINLLKNQLKDTTVVWQRRNRVTTSVLAAVIILELALGVLFFMLDQSAKKKIAAIRQQSQQTQVQLNAKQEELGPAKSLQAQLRNLAELVENHSHWSNFFEELSEVTYKRTQFTQLQADSTGRIYLEGIVGSYADLGKLMLSLSTSEKFSNVRLMSSSPNLGETPGLTFSVDMNLDLTFLGKKNESR